MFGSSKLIEDSNGVTFEYLDEGEAEFLYEEIFVRRVYFRHGIILHDGATVIDAGANIGLFSMHCLQEAKALQVCAFEPIPQNYKVLVRNLNNLIAADVSKSSRLQSLQVALGAEHAMASFWCFRSSPGESTRYPEEREQQRTILQADRSATSWRQVFDAGSGDETRTSGRSFMCAERRDDQYNMAETLVTRDDGDSSDSRTLPTGIGDRTAGESDCTQACSVHDNHAHDIAGRCSCECTQHEEVKDTDVSFDCTVVPLSLAMENLNIGQVDLLKVDVEGDELHVLQGVSAKNWPSIRQVVLEVHDVNGRLKAIIDILKTQPAGFDQVCWELQETSEYRGYVMVIPKTLRMFHVYARRNRNDELKQDQCRHNRSQLNMRDTVLYSTQNEFSNGQRHSIEGKEFLQGDTLAARCCGCP